MASCAPYPRVLRHQLPPLATVPGDFERYGCHPAGGLELECPKDSPIGKLGCVRLWTSLVLSGVTPLEPLAGCEVVDPTHSIEPGDYVLASGGLLPIYTRYLALSESGPVLLKSASAFRERYAPVDSPAEAITFVTALTDLSVFNSFDGPRRLRYFLPVLEETEVVATSSGYLVKNLLRKKLFGCGPHTNWLVDVAVSHDGSVQVVTERKAFEDPQEDGICVD